MSSKAQALLNLAEELRIIADEMDTTVLSDEYYARGVIVKAKEGNSRFKAKSLWVSLGNGNYRHLTGKKGLLTTHDRLDGYIEVLFEG